MLSIVMQEDNYRVEATREVREREEVWQIMDISLSMLKAPVKETISLMDTK